MVMRVLLALENSSCLSIWDSLGWVMNWERWADEIFDWGWFCVWKWVELSASGLTINSITYYSW